jgi:apolipoprotein N-acyltransferase
MTCQDAGSEAVPTGIDVWGVILITYLCIFVIALLISIYDKITATSAIWPVLAFQSLAGFRLRQDEQDHARRSHDFPEALRYIYILTGFISRLQWLCSTSQRTSVSYIAEKTVTNVLTGRSLVLWQENSYLLAWLQKGEWRVVSISFGNIL